MSQPRTPLHSLVQVLTRGSLKATAAVSAEPDGTRHTSEQGGGGGQDDTELNIYLPGYVTHTVIY